MYYQSNYEGGIIDRIKNWRIRSIVD
jgi:hypothetical protein